MGFAPESSEPGDHVPSKGFDSHTLHQRASLNIATNASVKESRHRDESLGEPKLPRQMTATRR